MAWKEQWACSQPGGEKSVTLTRPSVCSSRAPHQLREGEAAFVALLLGKAAEIADRLEMDAPHDGGQLQGLPHYGPDGAGVHPFHEGRDEDDAETRLSAIPDGLEFLVQERSSPQRAVDLVIDPVELEEDRREARGPEPSSVANVCGKAETVRIDLDEGITDPLARLRRSPEGRPAGWVHPPTTGDCTDPPQPWPVPAATRCSSSGGSSASPRPESAKQTAQCRLHRSVTSSKTEQGSCSWAAQRPQSKGQPASTVP